jgi:hypothetical protein
VVGALRERPEWAGDLSWRLAGEHGLYAEPLNDAEGSSSPTVILQSEPLRSAGSTLPATRAARMSCFYDCLMEQI